MTDPILQQDIEVLREPTNHDLHVALVVLNGKLNAVLATQPVITAWQDNHEKKDDKRFGIIHGYAASAAIAIIGFTVKLLLS